MQRKPQETAQEVAPERVDAISREDIRQGIIKGAKIVREGLGLAGLGWKTAVEGWEETADRVVDTFFIIRK